MGRAPNETQTRFAAVVDAHQTHRLARRHGFRKCDSTRDPGLSHYVLDLQAEHVEAGP
jgi:hypothetical protein